MACARALSALALALPLVAAAPAGFVDPKLCAGCHRQIAGNYARTGMGRSFYRPSASTLPDAPRDFYHDRSDTHYAVSQRDGAWYQRRWQIGFGGKEANIEELRIDYVMGSGNHARSFLHRTAGGLLIELPFGWYSGANSPRGAHWDMSPGSDSARPMTRRFISYKCMFCHNGVPRIPDGHDAPGSDPVYTGELPQGIDCQRCHGPGARHVETVGRSGSKPADIHASIVNPARLDPVRSMEICMSCHLETTSGRIPATIVRFDRAPFSYVPGEPLANFMLTFDHAPGSGHDDKFEAVSSVYRLRQSKCFNQSGGKLTCTTCHDPHDAPRGLEAVARYSQKCAGCHTPHVATTDCITCHMPKRRAEDTPGMVMTDHLIQRRPPARDLVAEFRERAPELYLGEVVPYYPKTVDPLYYAVAQVGNRNNIEIGLPLLRRDLAVRKPVEPEFYDVLADAAGDESLRRRPKTPPLSDPMLPDWQRRSGETLLAAGKLDPALDALRGALRTDPSDDIAWDLAGRVLAEKREWPESFYNFERALRLRPNHATYLYDYALALARAGRYSEARPRVEAAIAADPNDSRARLLLTNILKVLGW